MRCLAATVAAALVLAACGGESDEDAMVAAISASIQQDETFAGSDINAEQADCVAESTVDGIGVERLSEIGFDDDVGTNDEIDLTRLSDEEVGVIGGAMEDCIDDLSAVLADTVATSILADPDPSFPIDEEAADCIAQAVVGEIPASRLITIGVQTDRGGESDLRPVEVDVFADAYTDCIDVRALLLEGIASADSASGEVLDCLDRNISDDDIDTIFRAGLSGADTAAIASEILSPAVETCTGRV